MTGEEWIAAYAAALGVQPPDAETVASLLALAATAAHASERTAAPVACWLAGAAGRPLDEAVARAEGIGHHHP